MASFGLANPTIEINDRVIEYKPNSLSYKGGKGDLTVRHQTGGGDAGSKVITEDANSKVSMVKFTMLTETGNTDLLNEWLEISRSEGGNVIRLSAQGFTRSFRRMRVTEDPEVGIGAEGEFEIDFQGDPAS